MCHPFGNSDGGTAGGSHQGDTTAGFMSLDQKSGCVEGVHSGG